MTTPQRVTVLTLTGTAIMISLLGQTRHTLLAWIAITLWAIVGAFTAMRARKEER